MSRVITESEHSGPSAQRERSTGQERSADSLSPGEKGMRRYMPGLDGLRTLAVFAVIVYHLNPAWAPGGLLGVGVFFVLSGYLITDILIAQWKKKGKIDLKDFWLRRMRRLLPLFLVMLVAVGGWLVFTNPSRLPMLQGDIITSLLYVNNWWLIFHKVSYFESFGPLSPFGHLWSLAVEEQFYIVWPFLLWLGLRFAPRRGRLAAIITVGAAASAIAMALLYVQGTDPSRVYYGTDTRAFALLIGAALAVLWPSWKLAAPTSTQMRNVIDSVGSAGLIVIIFMIWATSQYDDFLYRGGMVVLSLAAAATIAALVHPASRLGAILGCKPLRWLGVRSYGIYIWHYPIIVLTDNAAPETFGISGMTQAAWQVAAAVGLAALSWRFVEEPIRRRAWVRKPSRRRVRTGKSGLMSYSMVYLSLVLIIGVISKLEPPHGTTVVSSAPQTVISDHPAGPEWISPDRQAPGPSQASTDFEAVLPVQAQPEPPDDTAAAGPVQADIGTDTASPEQPPVSAVRPPEAELSVTAIGDSVILDAAPFLKQQVPDIIIDGKVGRQFSEAKELTIQLQKDKKLGTVVVVELGTNGTFSKEQLKTLLETIGSERKVVLVNTRVPRPWEGNVNENLKEAADTASNVTLVDWYSASAGKNDYFAADGVHLKEEGARLYASLVIKAIGIPARAEAAAAKSGTDTNIAS
ncbi:acyltransferase family protein [Paenibacillus allorhizosphaerae]|uniref:O-acetyltransferase OatA n=1 Tax=Paenibacillus allorhizosphaerae TaxID=2849866 RepID=A0ABM8VB39_9BACL|nr:acyltransferase family protein [Paenibacillus allorhizosphaerae]CAG7618306.1 O-acetyltransferase OatA [Paenibacillus allorhizosphaerae]